MKKVKTIRCLFLVAAVFVAGSVIINTVNSYAADDEEYSDDFKKLTSGVLTVKTDGEIDSFLLNNYLWRFGGGFSVNGPISDGKVPIKLSKWDSDTSTTITEEHLVTIVKDPNIDLNIFDRVGYAGDIEVKAVAPSNPQDYLNRYFNATSIYFYNDEYSEQYDEYSNYESPYSGLVVYVKHDKRGALIDAQVHRASIHFVGYDNTVSDEFNKKIGSKYTIRADSIDLYTIDSALMNTGSARVLDCNDNFTKCDIALVDYANNSIEVHAVDIELDNTVSEEFKKAFNIKDDGSIDIISDSSIATNSWSIYSSGYDPITEYNRGFQCDTTNNKCKLILSYKQITESHEVAYNFVNSGRTSYYSSLVKDSIEIYPGETNNYWDRIYNSHFSKKANYYDYFISVFGHDSIAKKCAVGVFNANNQLEVHDSSVIVKDGMSPQFAAMIPGNSISINAIYKNDVDYIHDAAQAYFLSKTKTFAYLEQFYGDKAKVVLDGLESHTVDVSFTQGSQEHKLIVDGVINKMDSKTINFEVIDLEYVNFFYYNDSQSVLIGNYDSKAIHDTLTKMIDDKRISYYLVNVGGGGDRFEEEWGSRIMLYYGGIAYGEASANVVTAKKNIIYIPDDTPDDKESYIKAAQNHIDDYLGSDSGVAISFVEELDKDWRESISKTFGIKNFDGNCYRITYKDKQEDILIIKNSARMQTATFNAADVNNNINISSDNANYPTNTVVSSKKIEEGSEKYNELLNRLGLDRAQIVDIDLYSPTIGDIKNFDGVSFDVSLPIDTEKFEGEELYAYYVGDDGKIEEHPVAVDDFIGTFGADHFSTYVISGKVDGSLLKAQNPSTLDDIVKWAVVGGSSAIAIIGACVFIKNKRRA